jgi:hypothetical protein
LPGAARGADSPTIRTKFQLSGKVPPPRPPRWRRSLNIRPIRWDVGSEAPHPVRNESTPWLWTIFYPVLALIPVVGLTLMLTAFSGAAVLLLPRLVALPKQPAEIGIICVPVVVWALWIAGSVLGFLHNVLAGAAAGQYGYVPWPEYHVLRALAHCARWLVCLLAGPIIPLGTGFLFWMNGGDPLLMDWFILAEMVVVGLAYWCLAVLAVSRVDRLRDANPARIAELVQCLGYRLVALALIGAGLMAGHAVLAGMALDQVGRQEPKGWLWLAAVCGSAMTCATCLVHGLGAWCHRRRL